MNKRTPSRLGDKILGILQAAPGQGLSKSELKRRLGNVVAAPELREAMKTLLAAGLVSMQSGGRVTATTLKTGAGRLMVHPRALG